MIEVIKMPMWKFERVVENGRGSLRKDFCLVQSSSLSDKRATVTITLAATKEEIQEFIKAVFQILDKGDFSLKYHKQILR